MNTADQVKQVFSTLDTDGDGVVTLDELRALMRTLGHEVDEQQLASSLAALDRGGSSGVDATEFGAALQGAGKGRLSAFRAAFRLLDKDGDGSIEASELSGVADGTDEQELRSMIDLADQDGDGRLDFAEFVLAMSGHRDVPSDTDAESLPDGKSEDEITAWIKAQADEARAHRAARHPYLLRLANGDLPDVRGALRDFAVQYAGYSRNFRRLIERAAKQLTDPALRTIMLKNLAEESGEGGLEPHDQDDELRRVGIEPAWVAGISHPALFRRFQEAMGIDDAERAALRAPVIAFNRRIHRICAAGAPEAIGALGFGTEAIVRGVYEHLLKSIKRHTELTPEQYVFFTLHAELDDHHAQEIFRVARTLAMTPAGRSRMRRGMLRALEVREIFFDAMLADALRVADKVAPPSQAAELYDTQGRQWARTEPSCLSDFTARPAVFDLCGSLEGARVLDLGCGEGYCAREIRRRGAAQVVGVDISAAMIDAAKAWEAKAPLGIAYVHGDVTDLDEVLSQASLNQGGDHDVLGEGYDVIVAVFLFNYLTVSQMRGLMTRVARLLKPGGRFVFTVPHPSFAFWSRPSTPPFYFQRPQELGYFSGVDEAVPGVICRRDGAELRVQVRHKTLTDYVDALREAGFEGMPEIRELHATPALVANDPAWMGPLKDTPLHLAFRVDKPAPKETRVGAGALVPDVTWSRLFSETDYCLNLPSAVIDEFRAAYRDLTDRGLDWQNLRRGDAGPLPCLTTWAHDARALVHDVSGFALIQRFPLEDFGRSYDEQVRAAKTFYLLMGMAVGEVIDRRGRMFDIMDRGLDIKGDNVLFSATRDPSGWHTDSTDRDLFPDIVALLSLRAGKSGGKLRIVNALNVYHRLSQILPAPIFRELERPTVRALIESGLGKTAGQAWERVRRSAVLGVQKERLRRNAFPIFQRNTETGQFSFRYMRFWLEQGHAQAGIPLSPGLIVAMNGLDEVMEKDPTLTRIERVMQPGEIGLCNNHICAHDRTGYVDDPERPRHKVRLWVKFNPYRMGR